MDEGYDAINVARAYDIAAGRPLADPAAGGAEPPRQPGQAGPAGRAAGADGRVRPRPTPSVRAHRAAAAAVGWSIDRRWSCSACSSLAAVLRLPDLATRGTWDADQGHDMLGAARVRARRGRPAARPADVDRRRPPRRALLLPALAPAAALTGGDSPLAVVAADRAGRDRRRRSSRGGWHASIGGPVAGLVAGLAMAVSASAIDESTFIWNPNLIALSSAVALAGAWRAWTTRRPRWWLLAAVGTAVTMQCHVLGVTLLPDRRGAARRRCASRRGPAGPARRAGASGSAGARDHRR